MLWLEPDVAIVRAHWLDAAAQTVESYQRLLGGDGIWMLGSIPRGDGGSSKRWRSPAVKFSQRFHLNGNAVYNVGSDAFHRFVAHVRNNSVPSTATWQSGRHGNAFDVDIATYLWQVGSRLYP